MARVVVTGGAGFLGSHLCDALIARGDQVVCVDNFVTGRELNVAHLAGVDGFLLVEHDVSVGMIAVDGTVDAVMNLASPASPKDYLALPLETLAVGSSGTRNLLELALAHRARTGLACERRTGNGPVQSRWDRVTTRSHRH